MVDAAKLANLCENLTVTAALHGGRTERKTPAVDRL